MSDADSSRTKLPSETPRPAGELEELTRIWAKPEGWRKLTAVNNTDIGLFYMGAAFLFFLLAGVLALLMRTQLARGDNSFIGQNLYNQIFTVHGTTMMFLFAVPAVEALGVILLPQMLAARDLPFPRLSAFAIWAYVIGGLVFFSTIFYDLAPYGGWFMYPPLTLTEFSPGDNADFWLLGIGFIEISAIAGAIEIVVGTLRTRPPGMSLDKMPIFAWAMLIFAAMIIFAFPAVILATMLLEIERSFGWPFFTAAKGGDPLLWQHLFWFFGHPEVYIIFLPAAALVSMIVPTMARTPLVGYRLNVVALIATGFFSFGLWVHHMFSHGDTRAEPGLLFRRQHDDRDSVGHPGLLLDRDHRRGTRSFQNYNPVAVRPRLSLHLRHRRAYRRDGGDGAFRFSGPRHLLRRRAFPLRAGRRNGVPAFCDLLLLGADGQPQPVVGKARTMGFLAHVHRASTSRSFPCTSPVSWACRGGCGPIRAGWAGMRST